MAKKVRKSKKKAKKESSGSTAGHWRRFVSEYPDTAKTSTEQAGSPVNVKAKEITPKLFTFEIDTRIAKMRYYRIAYDCPNDAMVQEDVIVQAYSEEAAIQKFFEARSSYKIQALEELPDANELRQEIAGLKAELSECQKRKNPASRKKAKTNKKT